MIDLLLIPLPKRSQAKKLKQNKNRVLPKKELSSIKEYLEIVKQSSKPLMHKDKKI